MLEFDKQLVVQGPHIKMQELRTAPHQCGCFLYNTGNGPNWMKTPVLLSQQRCQFQSASSRLAALSSVGLLKCSFCKSLAYSMPGLQSSVSASSPCAVLAKASLAITLPVL